MESIHHVVLTTDKRSINPGRLQYCEVEGPFQVLPTDPVGNKMDIATCELHRKRASGDVVGTQIPVELRIERADSLVRVRVTRNSANWVDLRC